MALNGRKILCVGGNGYTGNYFASRFIKQMASVAVLSRQGPKHNYPENSKIKWIRGNILEPSSLKQEINSYDTIVHTVGTLIDSSLLKGTNEGGPGTYEQINRDTFLSLLSVLQNKKKIIYLSSNGHPPFLHRYLTTKHEAERKLKESIHEGYSVRPGFIYSWEHRKWSIPLKYQIQLWRGIYPLLQRTFPQSKLKQYLKQFKQGENTSLEELGDAIIQLSKSGGTNFIIENQQIGFLSRRYHQKG